MKKTAIFCLTFLFFSGIVYAQAVRYLDDIFTTVNTTADISYGSNINRTGSAEDLKLDIYQPAGDTASSRALLIVFHEGGFLLGNKNDNELVNFANRMAKKGYVVASAEYRKGWTIGATAEQNAREIVPALWRAMQDGKAAVRFFRKNAAIGGNTYKIDPNKIIAGGFGAGSFISIHNEYFDLPAEFAIPKVRQKDSNGDPTNVPYIDTTKAGMDKGAGANASSDAFEGGSGSPGYSSKVLGLFNLCGALGDTLFFNAQKNNRYPPIISCHGDNDQTTPYKTAVVYAQGTLPVLEVSGSYDIARVLYHTFNGNHEFEGINDGLPVTEMKKEGTYTFYGKNYQPYDQDKNSASYQQHMDTVVWFLTPRLYRMLFPAATGLTEYKPKFLQVYPNPASDKITVVAGPLNGRSYDLFLYDAMGRLVNQQAINHSETVIIEKGKLPAGVYLLKLRTDQEVRTARVIFE